jgi:predicted Zn-dependent protease
LGGGVEILTLEVGEKYIATAFPDGTIFMSTSQLSGCYKIGQVSAILVHEMGHLIARHTAERFSRDLMANNFAELFSFDSPMSNTLAIRDFKS